MSKSLLDRGRGQRGGGGGGKEPVVRAGQPCFSFNLHPHIWTHFQETFSDLIFDKF